MLKGSSWILNKGWTWVPNPYLYRRSLTRLDTEDFTAGDRIVSKNSGFAEFNGTTWEGDLTMLNPGEGYLFYTNGAQRGVHLDTEFNWDAEDDDASESGNNAKQMGGMGNMVPWHYDASQWRDNMSIIADGSGMNGCIIGAFVGDECRGIGRIINGKFFITIHGQGGETVNFRLYDGISSDTYTITESMPFNSKAGTLKNPVKLTIANGTTGINSITTNESNGNEIFGTNGVRRQTIQRGVNIIRKADGTVKKVMK